MSLRSCVPTIVLTLVVLSLQRDVIAQVRPLCPNCLGGVAVTPDGGTDSRPANGGPFSLTFNVHNLTTSTKTFALTCSVLGGLSCVSVSPSPVTLLPDRDKDVTVTFNTRDSSGILDLLATATGASDDGYYTVTVTGPAGPPVAALRNHNADRRDRGLCLTTGAGEAAGVACGDLFVVHATPAYRTLGRDRSLTLHYNSATATGLFLLAADVTQPASIAVPTNVQVMLTVGTSTDSAEYPAYAAGETRQVVIGRGLASQSTGVYPLTLRVRNVYVSGPFDTTITTTALIVNRATSEYGRGWSLLGIERVLFDPSDTTRLVWVAGDASIRLYRKPTPSSNVFVASPGFAPDSLVRFDTLCTPACLK